MRAKRSSVLQCVRVRDSACFANRYPPVKRRNAISSSRFSLASPCAVHPVRILTGGEKIVFVFPRSVRSGQSSDTVWVVQKAHADKSSIVALQSKSNIWKIQTAACVCNCTHVRRALPLGASGPKSMRYACGKQTRNARSTVIVNLIVIVNSFFMLFNGKKTRNVTGREVKQAKVNKSFN